VNNAFASVQVPNPLPDRLSLLQRTSANFPSKHSGEYEFDRHDAPLSWHLTPHDKESIEENWHEELSKRGNSCAGWEKVQAFLADSENSE
jgi:hypothetical protein